MPGQVVQTKKRKADFLAAYALNNNIASACEQALIGRSTVYQWLNVKGDYFDVQFKEAFDDIREADLDFTEDQLRDLVKAKNLGAICFKLKCQGKHRGWIEVTRQEVTGEGGGPVIHDIGERLAGAIERSEKAIKVTCDSVLVEEKK